MGEDKSEKEVKRKNYSSWSKKETLKRRRTRRVIGSLNEPHQENAFTICSRSLNGIIDVFTTSIVMMEIALLLIKSLFTSKRVRKLPETKILRRNTVVKLSP